MRDNQGPHTVLPYSGTGGRNLFSFFHTYTPRARDPTKRTVARTVLVVNNLQSSSLLGRLSCALSNPSTTWPRSARTSSLANVLGPRLSQTPTTVPRLCSARSQVKTDPTATTKAQAAFRAHLSRHAEYRPANDLLSIRLAPAAFLPHDLHSHSTAAHQLKLTEWPRPRFWRPREAGQEADMAVEPPGPRRLGGVKGERLCGAG